MRVRFQTLGLGVGLAALLCTALFLAAAQPSKFPFTFITVDVPVPGAASTMIVGINNQGDLVGSYNFIPQAGFAGLPSGFLGKGFIWRKNGQFTTIDGPGPVNSDCQPLNGQFSNCYYIEARGINESGDVVGTYSQDVLNQPGGLFRGFVWRNGAFHSYLFPEHTNTIFQRITDSGIIYGCYHDFGIDDSDQASMHGIINRLAADGTISNLVASPEGSSMNLGGDTQAHRYTGVFYDYQNLRHSSYIINNGKRTNFDMPGSNLTQSWDMNNAGDVVGVWGNNPEPILIDGFSFHGFFRDRSGTYININVPDSLDTHVFGINERGDIVGSYVDQQYNLHGFIARPGNHQAEMTRSGKYVNAAYDASAAASAGKVQVAMMPVVPKDTPLLPAAKQAPACHMVPKK